MNAGATLAQRKSAMRLAREMLPYTQSVDQLLRVADWLLGERARETDAADTNSAGSDETHDLVIPRPEWWGEPLTALTVREAFRSVVGRGMLSTEERVLFEVVNRVYSELRKIEAAEGDAGVTA